MNKKSKSKKWSDIYAKCNHNKYSQLTDVRGKSEIKSNLKNFLVNYKYIIISVFLIFLLTFIYAFRNNPIIIIYCIGFVLAFFLLMVLSSTYKITLDEKNLTVTMNFQTNKIKTDELASIFLSRDCIRFFGIPIYSYILNFIYIENDKNYFISLPLVMTNKKSVLNLFSNISTKKIKDDDEEKQNKTTVLTIIIVCIVVFLISSIIGFIIYSSSK